MCDRSAVSQKKYYTGVSMQGPVDVMNEIGCGCRRIRSVLQVINKAKAALYNP